MLWHEEFRHIASQHRIETRFFARSLRTTHATHVPWRGTQNDLTTGWQFSAAVSGVEAEAAEDGPVETRFER
jgi:hypothetical protein